jgi:hypothetical protein
MNNQKHPITPPPELVQQWRGEAISNPKETFSQSLATRAAEWGADQELEACCETLDMVNGSNYWSQVLRSGRRPKLPSLKEQALDVLHLSFDRGYLKEEAVDTIRRALESINE